MREIVALLPRKPNQSDCDVFASGPETGSDISDPEGALCRSHCLAWTAYVLLLPLNSVVHACVLKTTQPEMDRVGEITLQK